MKLYCSMAWISRQSATPVCHFINGWLKLWSMGQGGDTPTNSAASCRNKKTCRKRTWKVGKVINWIQTLKQIYWFHGYKRGRGRKGEEGAARQIEYTPWTTKIKNRYANTRTHTHTCKGGLPGETSPTHFFAPATCQIFATDYASGESEIAQVSDWVQCMCVCGYVCVWETEHSLRHVGSQTRC